ncbi:lipopolysaccharide biosynthesis protein [Pseudomonas knackmussii]|uniref:lipopolysaccharide biosynthesis protein n=1 Tax=Pseudomonas knackmussii TaxID=65741 RepID=UPI003F4A1740
MNTRKLYAFAVGPIVGAGLGLITIPAMAWLYTPEQIGKIAMYQVWLSMCLLILTLGLDQAYVREYHNTEDKAQLLINSSSPSLVFTICIVLLGLAVPETISAALFGIKSTTLSIMVACCTLATVFSRFITLVLRLQERGLDFSLSQISQKSLLLIFILALISFKPADKFTLLVAAFSISYIAATLYSAIAIRSDIAKSLVKRPQPGEIKKLLTFSAPLIVGGFAFWGLTSTDRLFLRNYSSFNELGTYSIALSFASIAVIFQTIFTTVWAPLAYKWANDENSLSKIPHIIDTLQAVISTIFSVTALLSWLLTYLLPKTYEQAQFIIITCMALPLFYTLSEATAVGIGISRKTTYSMLATLAALLVNIICNYLLVPQLGAIGAGISTAISFWVFLVLRTELSIRVWRTIPRLKLYLLSFTCLCSAISFSIYGARHKELFFILWLSILFLSLLLLIKSLPNTIKAIRKK